jgi:hypothetical protein
MFALILAGVFLRLYGDSTAKSSNMFYVAFGLFGVPGIFFFGLAKWRGRDPTPAPSTKIAKGEFLPEPTLDV